MNRRYWFIGFLVVAGAGTYFWHNFYGWHSVDDPSDEFGMEFRTLGCNDDWPDNRPYEPIIQSSVDGSSVTYSISDPATCGYSVRRPKYNLTGNTLNLTYNLYTPSGELAACICEYKSEFRFRTNPKAQRVVFDHSED